MTAEAIATILVVIAVSVIFYYVHQQLDRRLTLALAEALQQQERLRLEFSHLLTTVVPDEAAPKPTTPFVEFNCVCGVGIQLWESLEPGQAAVINCDNCDTSYSVHLPQIKILPTEKFEPVWPFTKNAEPK